MSSAGKKYQELNESLNSINTSDLEKATQAFSHQKRNFANLARDIDSVPTACEAINDLQDTIDQQKRDLSFTLSSMSQQTLHFHNLRQIAKHLHTAAFSILYNQM